MCPGWGASLAADSTGPPRIAAVIAAFDEIHTAPVLMRALRPALESVSPGRWRILFVVAGTDGTREALEGIAREWANQDVAILHQESPGGLGRDLERGFQALRPEDELVVTMDADLNHDPADLPRLVGALLAHHADLVIGSRFVAQGEMIGVPLWKRVLSRGMNRLMSLLYGVGTRDKTSGYRIYRAALLRRIRFRERDFAFLPELLVRAHRAGFVVREEPIRFVYRSAGAGSSKMRFWPTVGSYLRLLSLRVPQPEDER